MHRRAGTKWAGLVIVVAAVAAGVFIWQARRPTSQHVFVVELDPRRVEMRPALTHGKVSRSELFSEAVRRLKPYAAINGTFYGAEMNPLGDVLIDGRVVNTGRYPCAIAVDDKGAVRFIRRKGDRFDWSGYRAALAAGPRLIRDGKIEIDMIADGFSTRGLSMTAARSGIGLTKDGRLLLVADTDFVTLEQFAETMRRLGAVDALNLDGGPASGLYCDGKILVGPTLRMTNLLVFYRKADK